MKIMIPGRFSNLLTDKLKANDLIPVLIHNFLQPTSQRVDSPIWPLSRWIHSSDCQTLNATVQKAVLPPGIHPLRRHQLQPCWRVQFLRVRVASVCVARDLTSACGWSEPEAAYEIIAVRRETRAEICAHLLINGSINRGFASTYSSIKGGDRPVEWVSGNHPLLPRKQQ